MDKTLSKFSDKLSPEEISFFQKILDNKDIQNFFRGRKIFKNSFIFLLLFSVICLITIVIKKSPPNPIFSLIIMVVFFIFIFINSKIIQERKDERKIKDYIFEKILRNFTSQGEYISLQKYIEGHPTSTQNNRIKSYNNRVIEHFLLEAPGFSIKMSEFKDERQIYIHKRTKIKEVNWFLNYIIKKKDKDFYKVKFSKKYESRNNFYAGLVIIFLILSFFGFFIFREFDAIISNTLTLSSNDYEVLGFAFVILIIVSFKTKIEYDKIKKEVKIGSEIDQFYDITGDNPTNIMLFYKNIFHHLINLKKISKNDYEISFGGEIITFNKKISKNYFTGMSTNLERYINFYLETKEIFYIISKI